MLYAFFWVIPRRLKFICRRFGALCLFHIHSVFYTHLPAYEDGTECSETPAFKFQTPGNHPKESIQQTRNSTCEYGLNLTGSKYEAARGFCEHGNKQSVLHKRG